MSDDNKAKMRLFHDEVVQNGNFAMLDALAAPNLVDHNPGPADARVPVARALSVRVGSSRPRQSRGGP